ncbi:unnamed protein product [Brassica rapa]|uniref:Uncharacterized protein n=1 Tax=Brassica campestris TaxID=3711 RepID=A0A3P5YGG1_BRACM|nr:unnamed protein product [Brassica rapa]VDC60433.1 unnamed protein product [Brassica rapa]
MVKGLQILVRNLPRPTYIKPRVKKSQTYSMEHSF